MAVPRRSAKMSCLQNIIENLYSTGILSKRVFSTKKIQGCSEQEIDEIELKYNIRFPSSYREYLQMMGKGAGLLFKFDHFAVSYKEVLCLTESELHNIQEYEEYNVELPENSFIISSRQGEQFFFIVCDNDEDSKVWYYNEWEQKVILAYDMTRL